MKAFMRRRFVFGLILGIVALATTPVSAGVWYWDSNGTASGAGDTSSGTWGTSSFWTTSSAGTTATSLHATTSADTLYFVAGPAANSGENPYTVSVSGSQNANSLLFQSSGAPTLSGGTIGLWGGGITVSQYAYGTTPQGGVTILSPISLQAPQTWTNSSSNALAIEGNLTNGGNALTIGGPERSRRSRGQSEIFSIRLAVAEETLRITD
jgi:hypothetical protein